MNREKHKISNLNCCNQKSVKICGKLKFFLGHTNNKHIKGFALKSIDANVASKCDSSKYSWTMLRWLNSCETLFKMKNSITDSYVTLTRNFLLIFDRKSVTPEENEQAPTVNHSVSEQ